MFIIYHVMCTIYIQGSHHYKIDSHIQITDLYVYIYHYILKHFYKLIICIFLNIL